jgi:hypothetical protein
MPQSVQGDLLLNVTVTGDGPIFDNVEPMELTSFQFEFTGSPARVVATIYGLIGNSATWGTLAVIDTLQGYASGQIVSMTWPCLVRKLKVNLGTLTIPTSGGVPSVSCRFAGRY